MQFCSIISLFLPHTYNFRKLFRVKAKSGPGCCRCYNLTFVHSRVIQFTLILFPFSCPRDQSPPLCEKTDFCWGWNTHTRLRFRRRWYFPVRSGCWVRFGCCGSIRVRGRWRVFGGRRFAVPATSPNRAAASWISFGGGASRQLNTSSAKSTKSNSDVSSPESTLKLSSDLPNRGSAGLARCCEWAPAAPDPR